VLETLEDRLVLSGSLLGPPEVPAATVTSLTVSSPNPSMGQSITLTATVSGTAAPSGTVAFFDNGKPLGTAKLDGSDQAKLDVKIMPFGMNTITAQYLGDSSHSGSLSAQVPITFGSPFERLMNNAYRGLFGVPITAAHMQYYDQHFGSTRYRIPLMLKLGKSPMARRHLVQNAYAIYMVSLPTPAQTVQTLRAARLLGGSVQAAVVGSRTFYEKWSGHTTDGYLNVLASSTIGVPFSASERARFASELEHGTPLLKVAYQAFSMPKAKQAAIVYVYEAVLGRLPSQQELARASRPAGRPVNVLRLEVELLASDEYLADIMSAAVPATHTTLTATPGSSSTGQPVTFTATVRASNAIALGPIQGYVEFLSGTKVLGTAPVGTSSFTTATAPGGAVATFTTSALPPGSDHVVAMYMGNVAFAGSSSAPVTVTVGPAATASR
jgi:hypothetical protein